MSRRDQILDWTDEDEKAFRSEARRWGPRQQRAQRFANEMVGVLDGFLPSDKDCRLVILDYLRRLSFKTNSSIINVPPEWDHLDKLAIEKCMLQTKVQALGLDVSNPFMSSLSKPEKP